MALTDSLKRLLSETAKSLRAIYHTLSRIHSGGGAGYLCAVAAPIAGNDASLLKASSSPSTPPLPCYTRRYIERLRPYPYSVR
jgi:hypothetical protein